MTTDIIAIIVIMLTAFHLVYMNIRLVDSVYQWGCDAKAISRFLEIYSNPDMLKNDFAYRDIVSGKKHYLPFIFPLWLWLHRQFNSTGKTFLFIHIVLACSFIAGISLLTYTIYHSAWVAALSVLITIPCVMIQGHTMQAGLPRTYSPRDLGNALVPFFFLFLFLSQFSFPHMVLAAALSAVIFNINPRNGFATTLATIFMAVFQCFHDRITILQCILPALIAVSPCLPYSLSLFSMEKNMTSFGIPEAELQMCQETFRQRSIWPKTFSLPSLWGSLWNERGQLSMGVIYLAASGFVAVNSNALGAYNAYLAQSAMNLIILSALLNVGEHAGIFVLTVAVIGLFRLPSVSPEFTLLAMTAGAFLYYQGKSRWALALFLSLSTALACLHFADAPMLLRPSAFDLITAWITPVLFFVYLAYGALFHWLIPFVWKKKSSYLMNSQLLMIVSMAFWQAYLLAYQALHLLIGSFSLDSLQHAAIPLLSIMTVPLMYHRYHSHYSPYILFDPFDDSDGALFDWVNSHVPQSATFHIVSNLPYVSSAGSLHTFATRFRTHTLRSITVCHQDGNGPIRYDSLIEWMKRMKDIEESIARREVRIMAVHAMKYSADYLIVSNDLLNSCGDFWPFIENLSAGRGLDINEVFRIFDIYTVIRIR